MENNESQICLTQFEKFAKEKRFQKNENKYQLVYADCPWSYKDSGCRGGSHGKYGSLSKQELMKIPVEYIVADTAVCLFWVTSPCLPQAFDVLESWGFEYKTVFLCWRKTTLDGRPMMGLGHYTRSCYEFLLLGTRCKTRHKGLNLGITEKTISQAFESPPDRTRHSKKPDSIRKLLENFFPNLQNRIELFARDLFPTWDAFGLQLNWLDAEKWYGQHFVTQFQLGKYLCVQKESFVMINEPKEKNQKIDDPITEPVIELFLN